MARNLVALGAILSICGIFAVSSTHAWSEAESDAKNPSLTNASAQAQAEAGLNTVQARVYHAGQARPGTLSIVTLLDRADATYGVGETLRVAVKSNEDAYITVFNVGASGRITQLFPNAYQSDNRIRAGETLEVPSAASDSRIKVTGPVGNELIKVIATSKPLTVVPDTHFLSGNGLFRTMTEGAEGLDRDLQVVSANQARDIKVAIIHQVIRTVPARPAVAGNGTLVVPMVGVLIPVKPLPVKPLGASSGQRFPLLLAVDKASYRAGEPITMAITPLKSCYLTVIGTDNAGFGRRIFPSVALPSRQISGGETILLSGGNSAQTIVAGRPGKETIRAVCMTEPRTGALHVRAATEELTGDEKQTAERDLAVVPNELNGPIGYAEISFGITR